MSETLTSKKISNWYNCWFIINYYIKSKQFVLQKKNRMESEKYKEFKKVKKLNKIELFYCNLFNSFQALNKCFKKKHPRLLKYYIIGMILIIIFIDIIW